MVVSGGGLPGPITLKTKAEAWAFCQWWRLHKAA